MLADRDKLIHVLANLLSNAARFTPEGDTLTGKPEGVGLGLPIRRDIVHHHGGSLTVRSALGQGSCFRMTLPLHV